ncbi:MAG: OmpH family outer membrane protein [Odoribacter sp.]
MKNLSIVLNVVLFVAVITLYVLYFSGHKSAGSVTSGNNQVENAQATKIVYINTDTLMNNYLLAVELNEAFLKKQEERRTELNVKAKSLDQEANEFQRKLQNSGFLSEARAVDARDQLLVKQENLRRLQQEMIDKSAREQSELNRQLFDEITTFLKEYNQEKGFNIVLSTQLGGNVLYAENGFDITRDIVNRLNKNYKKNSGTTKE